MKRSRLSISTKLPLGMAVLLTMVLSAMAVAGYWDVRASAMTLATERLDHTERQIVDLIKAAWPRAISALKSEANAADVIEALTTGSAAARERVNARWTRTAPTATLELWDASRYPVMRAGPALDVVPQVDAIRLTQDASLNGVAIGPLMIANQRAIQIEVAASLVNGTVVGYLVDRRPLNSSPQFMALLVTLIGTDARLLLGNANGGLWTDFMKPVQGPPANATETDGLLRYQRADGQSVFARRLDVPQTPWSMIAEVPQAVVLAPVQRFVKRAATMVIVLALAGTGVAWIFAGRFTRPLRRMTDQAVQIASAHASPSAAETGDRRETRSQQGRDELNRFAGAFDQMVAALARSEEDLRASNVQLERRVAERTAELTSANRELEAFSYSVSHDLRAPLRAMGGFAQILVEDHGEQLPAAARKHLDTIQKNAKGMGQLIDDLLALAKLGRQPIHRAPTEIAALAKAAADEAQVIEHGRDIDIVIGDLPIAYAERSLVTQAIANLVRNAVKFTRTREHARVEVGHVLDNGEVVYFVRDNGVGFDMQYADKLFGVFQRLHRRDQFEGTGVGLAIVHRVVSRHGGRVWAESEVGKGATFFFTLPGEASAEG